MNSRMVFIFIILIIISVLGVFIIIIITTFPLIDVTAKAVTIGAFAGAIGGIIGAAITSLVNLWNRERDAEEQLKDRVSSHALELTRMNYEIWQKSLEITKKRRDALAPIKVYRELYRALLELHKTGNWPDTINKLGLLHILEIGATEIQNETQEVNQEDA